MQFIGSVGHYFTPAHWYPLVLDALDALDDLDDLDALMHLKRWMR